MRFLANENLPGPVVSALREHGHDVAWIKESMRGAPDRIVLASAQVERRIVVTLDKDFGELAFRWGLPAECGVILIRLDWKDPDTDNQIAFRALVSRDDWAGHFAVIEHDRIRIRTLPKQSGPTNTWIYFATSEKAALGATLESVVNLQFLWRSARNAAGALIANVAHIKEGDSIVVAWRHRGRRPVAYLSCHVAAPLARLEPDLVIDKLVGAEADALRAAGYPADAASAIEGIRLDNVEECYFEVKGDYGGNNSIHRLAVSDTDAVRAAGRIPPQEVAEVTGPARLARGRMSITASGAAPDVRIDSLEVRAEQDNRAFDAYVMVDWSSSSRPSTGNDSIWLASGAWQDLMFTADRPENVPTRADAAGILRERTVAWRDSGKRVLVGFDFAFGYPAGFADALGLNTSGGAWRALHSFIAQNVTDNSNNVHNRDAFAAECNRRIGAPGPFWGCAKSAASRDLTQHRVGVFTFPHRGRLREWRETEVVVRKRAPTQSVWKLNCGVSVGGQTIVGIKHLDALARAVLGHRWPFDGWGTPDGPAIWFAEIFPSLVYYNEWAAAYAVSRDQTQVQSCLRYAAERDRDGLLKGDFDEPTHFLDHQTLDRVVTEEGWILWG